MTFDYVRQQIRLEHNIFKKYGGVKIYKSVKKLLKSEEAADNFMLSIYGGYSESELRRIKYQITYHNNRKFKDA